MNKTQTVTKSEPPTAAGIVSWCRGDREDKFFVDGVQRMLDRYVESCGLAQNYKEMCGRLREYVDWRGIGLGGEKVDELVLADARESRRLLEAAAHALKSYAFGNSATELAKEMAAAIDKHLIRKHQSGEQAS